MAEAGTSWEIVEVQLAAVGRRVLVFLLMLENNAINHPLGNGIHTTYKNGDLGDGLCLFYPHDIRTNDDWPQGL